jgi:hypothetical protein
VNICAECKEPIKPTQLRVTIEETDFHFDCFTKPGGRAERRIADRIEKILKAKK